jgi:hypothetical protein
MERLVNAGAAAVGLSALVSWEELPYADYTDQFLTETLPLLRQQGGPDDVHLVMYFDS